MDGTTPPGPPGPGSSAPAAPPADDLLFPAGTDAAWQRDRTPDGRSRWVVVSAAVATVAILGAAVLLGLRAVEGASGSVAPPAAATVGDLAAGTCYRLLPTDSVGGLVAVDVVACTVPHDGQVYAKVPLDFDTYPADIELTSTADAGCADRDAGALDPAVASDDTISATWYAPLEADWAESPHVATCVIESDDVNGLTRSWTVDPAA